MKQSKTPRAHAVRGMPLYRPWRRRPAGLKKRILARKGGDTFPHARVIAEVERILRSRGL